MCFDRSKGTLMFLRELKNYFSHVFSSVGRSRLSSLVSTETLDSVKRRQMENVSRHLKNRRRRAKNATHFLPTSCRSILFNRKLADGTLKINGKLTVKHISFSNTIKWFLLVPISNVRNRKMVVIIKRQWHVIKNQSFRFSFSVYIATNHDQVATCRSSLRRWLMNICEAPQKKVSISQRKGNHLLWFVFLWHGRRCNFKCVITRKTEILLEGQSEHRKRNGCFILWRSTKW